MGGKNWLTAAVLAILAVIAALFTACIPVTPAGQAQQPPPVTATALFTFDPIVISPMPVVAGQVFTISMTIGNTGSVPGTYKADLYINGSQADSQAVSVAAGASGQALFSTTLTSPGNYDIKIGPQSTRINVIQNRVPLSLKLDNGIVDGCDPVAEGTGDPANMIQSPNGHMLTLTAPEGGFVITSIEIFGYIKSSTYDYDHDPVLGGPGLWIYGPDIASYEPVSPVFTINIYDGHRDRLYTGTFNRDLFSYDPKWVTVTVSDVRVSGDFSIELLTHNLPKLTGRGFGNWDYWHRYVVHMWYDQICIGYENSFDVHSSVSEGGSMVPGYYPTYNWLFRADGYQPSK